MSRIISALFSRAAAGQADRIVRANIGVAGSVTQVVVGPILGAVGNIITSELTYGANRQVTNQVPEPSRALQAFYAGQLSKTDTIRCLANMNVSFAGEGNPNGNFWTFCWDTIIGLEQPKLSVETIVHMYRQRQLDHDQAMRYLGLHGITRPGDREKLLLDRGQVDFGTATSLWRQGRIADHDYVKQMYYSGIGDDFAQIWLLDQPSVAPLAAYEQWWLAGWIDDGEYVQRLKREEISNPSDLKRLLNMRTPISLGQTTTDYWLSAVPLNETARRMQLLGYGTEHEQTTVLGAQSAFPPAVALGLMHRGELPPEELPRHLSAAGLVSPASQTQWIAGQRPLPSPGQLVEWGSRDLWNGAAVAALELDAEFPPALSWWMQRQGWGELPATAFPAGANAPAVDPWDMVWRAHWRMPSLSQVIQAARIIRPDNLAQWRQLLPTMTVPSETAIEAARKAEGYSPPVRDWLVALAFKRLRPAQAVRLYTLDKRPRAWLIGQLLDYGYTQEAAGDYADMVDAQIADKEEAVARKERSKARADLVKELERGFALGTLTRAFVLDRLAALEYDPRAAESALEAIVARENLRVVEESIKRLRKAYLDGEFAPAELAQRLGAVGVLPEVTARYVALWTLQRTQSRRMFTTSKIQSLVADGKMASNDALIRLVNLGWTNPDALLMLAESAAKADQLAQRQAHAESLAAGKRQRELERVRKDALKLVKDSERHLAHLTPVSMLKRLVCEAIVSPGWAGDRMLAMGYDPDTVTLYLEDWAAANAGNKKCLPPLDDTTTTPSPTAPPAQAAPASGLMTLDGQPIPATGAAPTTAVLPIPKQGNP